MRHSIEKILVIVVSRIGDTLLTTPAIKSIANHYPNSKITILAHPKRLEVLSNLDFVHSYGKVDKTCSLESREQWRNVKSGNALLKH